MALWFARNNSQLVIIVKSESVASIYRGERTFYLKSAIVV